MNYRLATHGLILLSALLSPAGNAAASARYFEIDVVDAGTGRGVPLVELRTVNDVRYYTDSAGVVAVDDPELIGPTVYFRVSSPGYHYDSDSFGYHGVALKVVPGKKAVVKVHRDNIAERLYRITGAGIYRDSVLLRHSVPVRQPLLNGLVMGQDTVFSVPYHGKLYWFWGDTNRPSYPLGQFGTSGATSLTPASPPRRRRQRGALGSSHRKDDLSGNVVENAGSLRARDGGAYEGDGTNAPSSSPYVGIGRRRGRGTVPDRKPHPSMVDGKERGPDAASLRGSVIRLTGRDACTTIGFVGGGGGLDPSVGIDLTYWVDSSGFSRPMVPIAGATGPVWVGGLFMLRENGQEHLYTHYAMVDKSMKTTLSGLAEFDDAANVFKSIHVYDRDNPLFPSGQPFMVMNGEPPAALRPTPIMGSWRRPYLYCEPSTMGAFPLVRNLPRIANLTDSSTYESFTCLKAGARFDGVDTALDRDADGRLVWGWKRNTPSLGEDQANELVKNGKMRADERLAVLRDVDTDAEVLTPNGSVFWNAYRKRWILITTQAYGSPSFLGEVWFAEADTPVGPWLYAKKVATHDHYTFYNPTQHPFFDQDGGRLIYFEGTYTATFSDVKDITPRYDYNQLMYRVALDDPRLALPAPVYRLNADGGYRYGQREQMEGDGDPWRGSAFGASLHSDRLATPRTLHKKGGAIQLWHQVDSIPFYAVPNAVVAPGRTAPFPNNGVAGLGNSLPSSRRHEGLIPVYADGGDGDMKLVTEKPSPNAAPLFYALPVKEGGKEKPSPSIVPLYEYVDEPHPGPLLGKEREKEGGRRWYAPEDAVKWPNATRSTLPICRVWRNPSSVTTFDFGAEPDGEE